MATNNIICTVMQPSSNILSHGLYSQQDAHLNAVLDVDTSFTFEQHLNDKFGGLCRLGGAGGTPQFKQSIDQH